MPAIKSTRLLQFTIVLLSWPAIVVAQKLPQVQQVSLRAPANIKIDGKANDWGNKFEADNAKTDLQYTIANDDKKLYLVAKTTSNDVMNRIANGGIKLIIQKNGTKTDAGAPFVKFPYLNKGKRINVSFINIRQTGKNGMERVADPKSPKEAEKINDSLARNNNKIMLREHKWIYTKGIAGVDSVIAIYNDKGIQVASAVDSKKAFTYELAIELKLLGLQPNNIESFLYHIVVNGEPNKSSMSGGMIDMYQLTNPSGSEQGQREIERLQRRQDELSATTDFWGEYTLAK